MRVRQNNDLEQWITFFLTGIETTATQSIETIYSIIQLKEHLELDIIPQFGRRSHSAMLLLNYLFKNPVIDVSQAQQFLELSFPSSNSLISEFVKHNILKEMTGASRNRKFVFESYLQKYR